MDYPPLFYYLLYTGFFVLAILFSTLINGLFLRFSRNLGIRQSENLNVVRWAATAKPSVGGFSFYIVFLISASVYAIFRFAGQNEFNAPLVGLILSCSLGFLLGLADDAYNTVPFLKFGGQLICAVVFVSTGIVVHLTDSFAVNALFTVLWVVGLMNSINMLDNMDGITATVSATSLLTCLGAIALDARFFSVQTFMMIGVLGALIGFLIYNWNPARLYMGDTGSQFLGVFLAGLSIMLLWNRREADAGGFQFKQFVLPLLAFVVPVVDTATVFIHRMRRGHSPFVGGKDHTTHHLAYHGFSDMNVAFLIGGFSLAANVLCLILFYAYDSITPLGTFWILAGLVVTFCAVQVMYLKARPPVRVPKEKLGLNESGANG
jgi:UDP-GlcNAc:undecaprenyl-phosphate GlcNAc-1-phosphate transferase